MAQDAPDTSLAALSEDRRREAMARLAVLRPALEDDVLLARAAAAAGVPLRTAQRWLACYRQGGLAGLARPSRSDAGRRRLPLEFVELVEGLGLKRPRPSAAAIHRKVAPVARAQGWPVPSTRTVRAIGPTWSRVKASGNTPRRDTSP